MIISSSGFKILMNTAIKASIPPCVTITCEGLALILLSRFNFSAIASRNGSIPYPGVYLSADPLSIAFFAAVRI